MFRVELYDEQGGTNFIAYYGQLQHNQYHNFVYISNIPSLAALLKMEKTKRKKEIPLGKEVTLLKGIIE